MRRSCKLTVFRGAVNPCRKLCFCFRQIWYRCLISRRPTHQTRSYQPSEPLFSAACSRDPYFFKQLFTLSSYFTRATYEKCIRRANLFCTMPNIWTDPSVYKTMNMHGNCHIPCYAVFLLYFSNNSLSQIMRSEFF